MLRTKLQVCKVLEKSKETVLEFYKEIENIFEIYKCLNTVK